MLKTKASRWLESLPIFFCGDIGPVAQHVGTWPAGGGVVIFLLSQRKGSSHCWLCLLCLGAGLYVASLDAHKSLVSSGNHLDKLESSGRFQS
jgi:hypothetical protein